MSWGQVLLGGGFVLLWLVVHAVLRYVEVQAHLRAWGPGPALGAGLPVRAPQLAPPDGDVTGRPSTGAAV